MRKLLLKESSFQAYLSNINTPKNKKKLEYYTLLEFSKGKENSYDTKPIAIKDYKRLTQNKKSKFILYKDFLELSDIPQKFPLIKDKKSINTNKNNFKDFLLSSHIMPKAKKEKKMDSNYFNKSKQKLMTNSIEINKNEFPRYIFLNKIFKIKESKSKKEIIRFNSQSNSKSKSYKIKNKEVYKNYINKRVKLSYNINFESSFVHKIKTEYMIRKLKKKYPMKQDSDFYNEISDEDDENIQENRDNVDENMLNNDKIFKKIKNELFNQSEKNIIGNETKKFFKLKENKINFLYDINLLPNFKNNLLKKNGYSFQRKLEEENYIDYRIWRYLNKAKIRMQLIKDDENFNDLLPYEEEENKNKEILTNQEKINKKYRERYEKYEIEDYLSKKKENQSVVKVINERGKKLFYGTFLKIHNKKIE